MGELVQTTGTQNPGSSGTWQLRREGAPPGVSMDTEGNATFIGNMTVSGTLTVNGQPVGGGTAQNYGYPASLYGLKGISADPAAVHSGAAVGANQRWYARLLWPAGVPITNIYVAVYAAGTWDGSTTGNRIGVYDDTGAQLGALPIDETIWTVAGWRGGAVTGGPIAAPAADTALYIVPIARGMTGLQWVFPASAVDAPGGPFVSIGPASTHRRAAYDTGTALPASFDPTTVGNSSGYVLLCGYN